MIKIWYQVDQVEEEEVAALKRKVAELESALAQNHRGGREVEIVQISTIMMEARIQSVDPERGILQKNNKGRFIKEKEKNLTNVSLCVRVYAENVDMLVFSSSSFSQTYFEYTNIFTALQIIDHMEW